jgi:hypothetical protein
VERRFHLIAGPYFDQIGKSGGLYISIKEKLKKIETKIIIVKYVCSFFRITQYNADVHNTYALTLPL